MESKNSAFEIILNPWCFVTVSHSAAQTDLILMVAWGDPECTILLLLHTRVRLTGVDNYAQLESSFSLIQILNWLLLDGAV